jgi:hydrogenase maturation factor HypF (carbamoyltransferase family)
MDGFFVYTNNQVPVNDGGISLGQAYWGIQQLKKEQS